MNNNNSTNHRDDDATTGGSLRERLANVSSSLSCEVVPDFTLSCDQGKIYRLSDFRGTKVLLCFYDYAHCPQCAYSVGNLMGHQKKLAWASKLKVITVFLTNKEVLHDGLTNKNAPIPRLCDDSIYPFLALADPDGKAASAFRLGTKSIFPRSRREIVFQYQRRRANSKVFPPLPVSNFLPAEFLIDENGVLVDTLRAKKATEVMAMERIQEFLLGTQKEKYLESKRRSLK
jgi:peroxiredoxin